MLNYLIRRLGYGAVGATCLAGLAAMIHMHLARWAIEQVHHALIGGFCLLWLIACSAMFQATFFFRLLGVWCRWSRRSSRCAKARHLNPIDTAGRGS